ncbi:hypothetical protein [Yinghuangia sp. YIM S09857]|uniref:hypothetical protein n=1 Tax=Yinghuangia sp. YIM S09857 TaxID=3436929 RepID=UPI003F536DCE
MTAPTKTRVGPRGRVTIAAAIQRDTGLTEGEEVIVRSGGDGVVIVESVATVKARIRAAATPAPAGTAYDAVADVRASRDGDVRRDDLLQHGDRDSVVAGERLGPEDPGKELLRSLEL